LRISSCGEVLISSKPVSGQLTYFRALPVSISAADSAIHGRTSRI
jgi:hypothetical protein